MDDRIYTERDAYAAQQVNPYATTSPKTLDEEHMRLLMHLRLRSTFADAKFTEQSAIRSPTRVTHPENDDDLHDLYRTPSVSRSSSTCTDAMHDNIIVTDTNRASTTALSTPDSTFVKATTGSDSPEATTKTTGLRVGEPKYNSCNNSSRLAAVLRGIASKLEQNTSRSRRKRDALVQQLEQVMQDWEYSRLQWQEERNHLESCIEVLQTRANKLQEQVNMLRQQTSPLTEVAPVKVEEFADFEDSARIQTDRIKTLLYSDSSGPAFLSSLYRCIRCFPEVMGTQSLINYVTDAIRLDSSPLEFNHILSDHQQQEQQPYYRDADDYGQYVNDYESRGFSAGTCATVDGSSGDLAHVYDGRNAPRLNLYTLACIMRHSSVDILYRYLFAALECDNCRVVQVIMEAVGQKFLNFEFASDQSSGVLHPLLVAFGRARPSQAYRYLKMVDYDFVTWPIDPKTGDGLWHHAVLSKSSRVLHTLKNFGVYFDYIEAPNFEGKSALDVSSPKIKRELVGCMVIECAARGSECYKASNYKGALDWYTKAVLKLNLCDASDPPVSFANIGKIHYNRARALVHLNRWIEAIESCNACLEHIPSYYGGWETLIEAHRQLLDWQGAHTSYCGMVDACHMEQPRVRDAIDNQLNATLFQLLQVPINATAVDIKTAFKQQCKLWHPDKFMGQGDVNADVLRQCTNHFGRLVDARDGLLDASTRALETLKKPTNYIPPTPPLVNGAGT